MKRKKIGIYIVVIMVVLIFTIEGFAQEMSMKQKTLNQVNDKINYVKNKLFQNKEEEKNIYAQINVLDMNIDDAEKKNDEINKEIISTKIEMKEKEKALQEAMNNIKNKDERLNGRIRVMYENGNVGYMEVLLNSSSMVDMLSNFDMIQKIIKADTELLKSMKEQRDFIEENKKILQLQESKLIAMGNEAILNQKQLQVSRGKVEQIKKSIQQDGKALEKQVDEMNRYSKQIEEEIRKSQSKEAYKGGKFLWPAPGYTRITSSYGYRIHPILKKKKLHTGVDIAVPKGGNIVAAEGGKVIYAGWKGGYGKTVMVDHGGGIVTLYPHNSKLIATKGQKVKKGQVVSKAGSTGLATGPHLHFEVRKNGKYVNPMPWLRG